MRIAPGLHVITAVNSQFRDLEESWEAEWDLTFVPGKGLTYDDPPEAFIV